MAFFLSPIFGAASQSFTNTGIVLAGGLLHTYAAGSVSTNLATYTDSGGLTPNANPIVLDTAGRVSTEIWLTSADYKFVLTDSVGNVLGSWDNVRGVNNTIAQSNYDIAGFLALKPANSQIMLRLPMIRAISFGVNMLGSIGGAAVAATASTTFTIAKNGVNFGTMGYAIGATVPTFTAATPPTFAIGDILMVTAPASADATLSDVGFILSGAML